MEKKIAAGIILFTLIVAGFIVYRPQPSNTVAPAESVIQANGTQVVSITAKGGYTPRVVRAKKGVATVLQVTTKETYDCSISLVIPSLKFREYLPPTGVKEITIPAEKAEGTINGLCSMGMYSFKIVFD